MTGTRAAALLAMLAALALPAHAGANHTLAHKVAGLQASVKTLNAKLACLQKIPVRQYDDYAYWGIDEGVAVEHGTGLELDVLVPDVENLTALDFNFNPTSFATHAWVLGVKNNASCRNKFPTAASPVAPSVRAARLARIQ